MKVFEAHEYDTEAVTKFFKGKVNTTGFVNKKNLETLEKIKIFNRPFRRVLWKLEGKKDTEEKISTSFMDEQLSSKISDSNHRLLLWRPRYARLRILDLDDKEETTHNYGESIEEVINDLIFHRWEGQEIDDELRPKLRSLQADPLSAIALIVPRSPYSLRREEEILNQRREKQSFVMASSLVLNCSPKDIIISAEICERVFVTTIVCEYRDISDGKIRMLHLETPGSRSLQDATKSGAALSRICNLYPECSKFFA